MNKWLLQYLSLNAIKTTTCTATINKFCNSNNDDVVEMNVYYTDTDITEVEVD